ncbi:unnamed protein product, partial [marine sediment metagenome]
ELGEKKFMEMILDPSWIFVPEQWEAQMWARLFKKIPPEDLIYCSLKESIVDVIALYFSQVLRRRQPLHIL